MHIPGLDQFDRRKWTLSCVVFAALMAHAAFPTKLLADDPLWTSHIEPLLKEHCSECHNPTKAKSGLDLSSLQTILRGGDRGAAVSPGRPNESHLYKFLSSDSDPHMPPAKHKPLSEDEIGLIKKWIQELPIAPISSTPENSTNSPAASASSALEKACIKWKPPTNMPAAKAVDRFLELAWKRDKIDPAQRADDSAFARRVYLDLVGRIPTTAEAAHFLNDHGKEKRAHLIATRLGSEAYPRRLRAVSGVVWMGRS